MVNRTSLLARSFHHNKHIVRVCRLPSISIVAGFSAASTASVGAITLVKWLIDLLLLSHVPNKGRHPTSEPVTVNQLFTKSKSSGKTSKIAFLMIPCTPEQQKTAAFVSTLVVGMEYAHFFRAPSRECLGTVLHEAIPHTGVRMLNGRWKSGGNRPQDSPETRLAYYSSAGRFRTLDCEFI